MQAAPARPSPVLPAAARADESVQNLDDWAATVALMVATTLEPSCALAFCFGNHDLLGRRKPLTP